MGHTLQRSSIDELRLQGDAISQAVDRLRVLLESGASLASGLPEIEQHLDRSCVSRRVISTTLLDEVPPVPKLGLQRMAVDLSRMANHIGMAVQAMAAAGDVACREAFIEASVLLVGALRLLDEAVEDLHRKGVESRATKQLPGKMRPLIEAVEIVARSVNATLSLESMEGVSNKLCLRTASERLSSAAKACGHAAELIAVLISDLSLNSASHQTITY